MSARRSNHERGRRRRMTGQQIVLTVIGVLIIAAFILGSLATP